jgi:hypothetical protein
MAGIRGVEKPTGGYATSSHPLLFASRPFSDPDDAEHETAM